MKKVALILVIINLFFLSGCGKSMEALDDATIMKLLNQQYARDLEKRPELAEPKSSTSNVAIKLLKKKQIDNNILLVFHYDEEKLTKSLSISVISKMLNKLVIFPASLSGLNINDEAQVSTAFKPAPKGVIIYGIIHNPEISKIKVGTNQGKQFQEAVIEEFEISTEQKIMVYYSLLKASSFSSDSLVLQGFDEHGNIIYNSVSI